MFVFSLFRHTDFGTCVKRHSSAVNGTEKKKKSDSFAPIRSPRDFKKAFSG